MDPKTFPTNDPTNPLHRLADDLQCGRLKIQGVAEDVTYALALIECLSAGREGLRKALANIQIEAERENGRWNHLKRVIAINAQAALTQGESRQAEETLHPIFAPGPLPAAPTPADGGGE